MISKDDLIPARLHSKTEVSAGLSIFRFALERDLHFIPGQYATVWFTHLDKTVPRAYSIASTPSQPRLLEFYINLVTEGTLTPQLWEADLLQDLAQGASSASVAISGPKGHFVLDPEDSRDLVMVASGTGLAPFMSMIRSLEQGLPGLSVAPRRIYVIHGVRSSSQLGYREELEQMASESLDCPGKPLRVIYIPTVSRPASDPDWRGLRGRAEKLFDAKDLKAGRHGLRKTIQAIMLATIRPDSHAVYVCGHPATVDGVTRRLVRRGFKPGRDILREKYW